MQKGYLIIISYILIIFIITTAMFLNISTAGEFVEHRGTVEIQKIPPIRKILTDSDTRTLINSYLRDHYGMRNIFLKSYPFIKLNILGSNRIYSGMRNKEGWTFETLHPSKISFSQNELEIIEKNLTQEHEYLTSKNIPYFFVIVPRKQSVYTNLYPFPDKTFNKKTDQVLDQLKQTDVEVIDLREVLRNNVDAYPLYFKTDSHWTNYGAFISYQEIMRKYQEHNSKFSYLTEDDFEIFTVSHERWLGDSSLMSFYEPGHPEVEVKFKTKQGTNKIKPNKWKIITYGDSYIEVKRYVSKNELLHILPTMEYMIPLLFEETERPGYLKIKDTLEKSIAIIETEPNTRLRNRLINFLMISAVLEDPLGLNYFFEMSFEKSILQPFNYPLDRALIEKEMPDLVIREVNQSDLDSLLKIY